MELWMIVAAMLGAVLVVGFVVLRFSPGGKTRSGRGAGDKGGTCY
jgi:hypothetical protein